MGLYHSPSIATSGLVLYLDAGNVSKSYPGSGSTWTDVSGSGNHATMFGSVPFGTDVAPCFDFATATGATSSSSSLGFTFLSNMLPTTGNFTISCWIKNPNATVNQTGLFSNAGGGDGYRFGIGTNGVYYLIGNSGGFQEGTRTFTSTLSSSLWYNISTIYSRTTAEIIVYVNGVYNVTASVPTASTSAYTNVTPGLVRSPCCNIYTGKIGMFSAHNRSLTAQEIKQNFNALRGRFGV